MIQYLRNAENGGKITVSFFVNSLLVQLVVNVMSVTLQETSNNN